MELIFFSFSKDLEHILSRAHMLLDLGIYQTCLISREIQRHKLTKMNIKEIASEIAASSCNRCKFLAVDSSV